MTANELRLGNLINYRIVDELDERKEWFEPTEIDMADLVFLKMNPNDENYQPITLTEEWLLKFKNIKKFRDGIYLPIMNLRAEIHFEIYENEIVSIIESNFAKLILDRIKYVHQLQNLFFVLTNTELTPKN